MLRLAAGNAGEIDKLWFALLVLKNKLSLSRVDAAQMNHRGFDDPYV